MWREPGREPNRSVSRYRKPVVEISSVSKMKEEVIGSGYNLKYKFNGVVNQFYNYFQKDSKTEPSYILGRSFAKFSEAQEYYKKIIWFSYRYIPGLNENCNSDFGWGCLVRVGQMVMAASIKRYLLNKRESKLHESDKRLDKGIIVGFLENNGSKEEKYSLRNIVERASHKDEKLGYGKWFTCSQICSTLIDLHRKDRMNGTENLEFILFKHQTILISEVFEKMEKKLCACKKMKIMCQVCSPEDSSCFEEEQKQIKISPEAVFQSFFSKKEDYLKNQSHEQGQSKKKNHEKKVVIFVICQLGCEKPTEEAIKQVKELLKLESSLGALGGTPGKGLYFTGFIENDLIYLDPHCSQRKVEVSKLADRDMKTFYCENLRRQEFSGIDPSLAFAFYIDNLQSLRKLQEKSEEFKEKYEYPIFNMEWDNNYLRNSGYEESEMDPQELNEDNDLDNSFIEEQ